MIGMNIAKEGNPMKNRILKELRVYAILTLGVFIIAAGNHFFKFPNNFSTGGVTGMAVVLSHYFPSLSTATFVAIINYGLLAIGFLMFGRDFGLRTTYASIVLTLFIQGMEKICPLAVPMTTQPVLELAFAVALPAVGSALLFNLDASSGGTDIVAMILKKFTSLNTGNALLATDAVVTIASCAAFGMETGLFSMLGLFLKSVVVDLVLDNFHTRKCVQIITGDCTEIVHYIHNTLHRGATINHVEGAYSHESKYIILTVVSRSQALYLRKYARSVDPHAFIVITTSTEIFGNGFLQA